MSFITRNWLKISLLFIIVGVVLTGVGFMAGAFGSVIRLSENGLTVHNARDKIATNVSGDVGAFTAVYIDAKSADVSIVPSDHYGLEFTSDGEYPTWNVANGKLTITEKEQTATINVFGFYENRRITVYYPASVSFTDVTLTTHSGNIDFSGGGDTIKLKSSSGGIAASLADCESVDCESSSGDIKLSGGDNATLTLKSSSGSIKAENGAWRNISVRSSSGGITIDGTPLGESDFKASSGSVKLTIRGDKGGYGWDLTSSSGGINVDGEKHEKKASLRVAGGSHITVTTSSGSVRVDFKK